jgi:MSHA biogenesis protein MshO
MVKSSKYSTQLSLPLSAGFTLIELVVVLVVSSILAVGTVAFISRTVEGLDSATNRNKLGSAGRLVLDRIALELHNALPNSIRASSGGECLEFIPVRGATTYINPSFSGTGSASFDIVNFVEENAVVYPASPPALYAVVYPNSTNRIYDGDNGAVGTWPNFPNRGPIQRIAAVNGIVANGVNLSTVTLDPIDPGVSGNHRFRRRSPTERFFVVTQPVSFCVTGDKLYRYTNYGFYRSQSTTEEVAGVCPLAGPTADRCLPDYTSSPDKVLLVDSIAANPGATPVFTVAAQSLVRNSLVAIELTMNSGADTITLNHEVLSRSVP